jgi:hypothetical protein
VQDQWKIWRRYAEDEQKLIATEAAIAKLPLPTHRLGADVASEVAAALVLVDETDRLAGVPTSGSSDSTSASCSRLSTSTSISNGESSTTPLA